MIVESFNQKLNDSLGSKLFCRFSTSEKVVMDLNKKFETSYRFFDFQSLQKYVIKALSGVVTRHNAKNAFATTKIDLLR